MDSFEKAIMCISGAQESRRRAIAEFKGKFHKVVLDDMEKELYRHPIVIEWVKMMKQCERFKEDLTDFSKKSFYLFKDLESCHFNNCE